MLKLFLQGFIALQSTAKSSNIFFFSRTREMQLLIILLAAVVYAQDECIRNSCHPQLGDLLIGRSSQLSATSTCGLNGPQKYCILGYLENEQKCFTCDSSYPYNRYNNPYSHQIENIITTFEPDRKLKWWQSENGVDRVSIRLDLEALFQFSHLVLTFKTFRPAEMLIERSRDNGQTWKVFRYFSQDCESSFPGIPTGPAQRIEDVICDSKYSGTEPSTDGEVVLKALDPNFQIENPYNPHIQELITMTNLRVNFTRLLTLGDTLLLRRKRNPQEKYYYALYEMVVRGSCFCNGHASQCMPVDNARGDVFREQRMVHGRCVCQHNTDGLNCERCKDFYNDAPWRPAEKSSINGCKKCNCNGHSESCHFDMAVYLASGGVSGGVCENCQHNRIGPNCEQCRPFFYEDPYACIPCDCDPEGSLNNGMCESRTDPSSRTVAGRCICKENVEGVRCDRCKSGFFGISRDNPQGCQYCRCNRLGSVSTPSPCDPVTGECFCQRFAFGPLCDQCLQGYWGLGNTVYSCSLCDCDIGGAYNDMCSLTDGQCQCLPHIIGRRCNDPAPGYFFAPLDYYIYEAEYAAPLGNAASLVNPTSLPKCEAYFRQRGYAFKFRNGKFVLTKIAKRSIQEKQQAQQNTIPLDPGSPLQIIFRQRSHDRPVTWTGPGFVRVQDGAGLRFTVNNIPAFLDYSIVIRYEPESSDDWTAEIKVTPISIPSDGRCPNQELETKTATLSASSRIAILDTPVCLDSDGRYFVDIIFRQPYGTDSHILVDSIGLIPKIESLQNFCSRTDLDEYRRYQCIEIASEVGSQLLPEVCERLIASMSARIHNGAVSCKCNAQGSVSAACSKFGGQCQCKPNVIGRCCDTCAPSSFGFGSSGCTPCDCDPQGSVSEMCDQANGQCPCRREIYGRQCSQCQPGYFGFPQCRPCQCNGNSEICDPRTGACLNCRGFSMGNNCERCLEGYHGDPTFREPCEPCLCPDTKASGRYFAHSCNKDHNALQEVCNCIEGYAGAHCDKCPAGYYGSLTRAEDRCQQCHCNNNIDPTEPDACDGLTGECLKCLYNTDGPNCQFCRPGYFGSALQQNCIACVCNPLGTDCNSCPSNKTCICDQSTGQCPCLPNVVGTSCNECAPGFWDMGSGRGCQTCDCVPGNSLSNQCNQFSGQCQCRPEFEGKRCNECGQNFFGNPKFGCISCNCTIEGTERPVCDQYTGTCNCRTGVIGKFCDQCARGFLPEFPACTGCHPCFELWDKNVSDIRQTLQKLIKAASVTHDDKLPTYEKQFEELEKKLAEVQRLLNSPVASLEEVQKAEELCDQIRRTTDQIDPNSIVVDDTPVLNSKINSIRNELNLHFNDLKNRVKLIFKFDVTKLLDVYNTIKKHYKDSNNTEQRVKDTQPTIDQSRNTREKAIGLLDKASLPEDLDALQKKINELNVKDLNEKVCGAPGDEQCSEATCGGALCRDIFGNRKCGGPYCKGTLPVAHSATEEAKKTEKKIPTLLTQLEESEKELGNAKITAQETKEKASELSKKITKNKDKYEKEKEKTNALIKNVKDFLTGDSVLPEDIEKIAEAVLALKIPSSPSPEDLIRKIQNILVDCKKIESVIDNLNNKNHEVKELLEQAKEAEKRAKATDITEAKKALEKAKEVQDKVKKSINETKDNFEAINDNIYQTKEKLDRIEDNNMDLMNRLNDLNREIKNLKEKTEMNGLQAKDAKEAAEGALANATEAEKDLKKVNDQFQKLKEKEKGNGASQEAIDKAKMLKTEAEELAKDVGGKMKEIMDLEKKIEDLLKSKEDKEKEISELEDRVRSVRNEIIKRGVAYSTCQF
ncbi:laminin subunit beta-4 isoform X1 [Acipenser ruthenus]|uniref:laminin subunit beta-4 isoform X1 n=1 Tax=Acipenser ruthenus TaxID=7906 RepID=UPI0027426244|nr:laminin subunit beta-4 isoform X1 [Acipenser ruthenus]